MADTPWNDFHLPRELPVSLSPDVFESPSGAEGDMVLQSIKAALAAGRSSAEKALTAARAEHANEMRTIPARHSAAKQTVHRIGKSGVDKIQQATESVRKVIAQLEANTAPKLPSDAREQIGAQTIVILLAGMNDEKRRGVIRKAIAGGDNATVAAMLTVPPYLLDITPEEQHLYREEWRRKNKPDECARLDYLKIGLEHLERGGSLLVSFLTKCYGESIVQKGEQSEKATLDALGAAGAA